VRAISPGRTWQAPGAYDISNGEQPTYELIKAYARSRGLVRLWLPVPAVPARVVARLASCLTPLPHVLGGPHRQRAQQHELR